MKNAKISSLFLLGLTLLLSQYSFLHARSSGFSGVEANILILLVITISIAALSKISRKK